MALLISCGNLNIYVCRLLIINNHVYHSITHKVEKNESFIIVLMLLLPCMVSVKCAIRWYSCFALLGGPVGWSCWAAMLSGPVGWPCFGLHYKMMGKPSRLLLLWFESPTAISIPALQAHTSSHNRPPHPIPHPATALRPSTHPPSHYPSVPYQLPVSAIRMPSI